MNLRTATPNPNELVVVKTKIPRSLRDRIETHRLLTGEGASEAVRNALTAYLKDESP